MAHGEPATPPRHTRAQLRKQGQRIRRRVPRSRHAHWKPSPRRRDPIALLRATDAGRIAALLPIRYGRMLRSPFAFFRGAAAVMAADLDETADTGIAVQACGDCHLLNFGGFATPERRVIFDINDFDETLVAPWEWDVKRLATSIVLAGRERGFGKTVCRRAAATAVRSYRRRTGELAEMPIVEAWYASLELDTARSGTARLGLRDSDRRRVQEELAHIEPDAHDPKLARGAHGIPCIADEPPLIHHYGRRDRAARHRALGAVVARYRASLADDRRALLDRYRLVDFAAKVVGVGSVGTACSVALLLGLDNEPLFLQIKQARRSVLASPERASAYAHQGERIVMGQRLMQAASDVFLGWTSDALRRQLYVRQLHDVKLKPTIAAFDGPALVAYAETCGAALARAHARSGSAAVLAGYMGRNDAFDSAVAAFAGAYADQTEQDHALLVRAARDGKIAALRGRESRPETIA